MAGTTTVQRKTLVGALVLAAALGAGGLALVSNVDGGDATRISEVQESTTTAEETTTTEATTTSETVTTGAPTTQAPATTVVVVQQPAPLEQKVAEHEERITDLEATTTTAASPPPTVAPPTTEQNGNQ